MQKIIFSALLVLASASAASAQNLIVNGGFETGNFSGWSSTGTNANAGGCDTQWTVVTNNTPCFSTGGPNSGSYQAGSSWDGDGPQHFFLSQIFANPNGVTSGTLSFWETYRMFYSGQQRTLTASIWNMGNTNLGNIFSQNVGPGTQLWTSFTADATAILAANGGQNLQLVIDFYNPQFYTGPAAGAVDDISLDVVVSSTPEPASLVLMVTGLVGVAGVARRRKVA